MTDRHIFNDHTTLVARSLRGLVAHNPRLNLIPALKVVYRADADRSKVTTICGGGSGHEPGTPGFVGQGLLTAAVAGDVFASPSARQVLGAIKAVPSDKGTILIITNYTGDNLHFGLARLMAQGQGIENVELVVVGDDVSVPHSQGKMVGRRCLAGIILISKIMGAASEADMDFQPMVKLGRSMASNTASVCMALEHCHVPGRSGEWAQIGAGRCEIGLGLHNETGVFNIPQPEPEELFKMMLDMMLKQDDPERSFVKFADGDELILLVNNQGGLSPLEMGAVVDETLRQLEERGIVPKRVFSGVFMGSMNMPGVSLSLLNLTNVARECSAEGITVERLLEFTDAEHNSVAWPAAYRTYRDVPKDLAERKRADAYFELPEEKKEAKPTGPALKVNPEVIQAALKYAAEDVVALEPQLTKWDTIVGDGDCGETCEMGGLAVLKAVKEGLGKDGDLVTLFRDLTEIIDEACGGTLGAIFSIFLAGMTTSILAAAKSSPQPEINGEWFGKMALEGLETLKQRTAARVGHRTVMDALIPFADELAKTGDIAKAAAACRAGGESTSTLKAKLGRAAYVGDRKDQQMPPDPGAMAMVAVAEGIVKAANK
ncbi:uncharacterized protein CcaverHIS019_0411730 [Cutaneotrichosporon cavernicola]|uniref:Dihydroxyacetone kinase n=1 Tax=Cutaneotrichosporon cavernicola TaxID=279322 RepID=A0AA48L5M0_9TREE|nr:uncharacterized protein CcaverHIS019_0411730 [Cutaneotrichosporon cavernicola]BEI92353.1 hypothetical protein CcaverHIS019_0411730 [Cutaneotrichosporon cavernicola]BEJ00122.1 hypothetical protein CcaverHIS631_0411640 [Cutaneotrichosporon cavernicola]BEJ07893.1 hypothetical protein CcaverHIS641_0411620 [Cutaneotrichosporon cavernicola]